MDLLQVWSIGDYCINEISNSKNSQEMIFLSVKFN